MSESPKSTPVVDEVTSTTAENESEPSTKVAISEKDEKDESGNNTVEIYSYQTIESGDLEILLLFLENYKACGGGDIVSYTLDDKKRMLQVVY